MPTNAHAPSSGRGDATGAQWFSAPRVDAPMLYAIVTLVCLGTVMVGSSSSSVAAADYGDPLYHLWRQLIFGVAGAFALVLGASIDRRFLEAKANTLLFVSLFLLVCVLIPGIGHAAGGARRWFQLGPIGVQAGEIAKLALVVYLAAALSRRGERLRQRFGALPQLVVAGVVMVLLLGEPDFGTAVLLAAVSFVMVFVGGARVGYLAGLLFMALPIGLFLVGTSAYRMRRVLAFLDPWAHRYDAGYQITESLMTVGSGGLFGAGLGASKQKLFFLPAAHTDFILAVIGEELGFLGVLVVIGCFAVIGWRAFSAVLRARDSFSSFLIVGLSSMLILQAAFNAAVVLGLVPTKGITLPFVSYGGSSLAMSMLAAGVLLRACATASESAGVDERPRTNPALFVTPHKLAAQGGPMRALRRGGEP